MRKYSQSFLLQKGDTNNEDEKNEVTARKACVNTLLGILIAGIILGIVLAWIAGTNDQMDFYLGYKYRFKEYGFNWKLFFYVLVATIAPFVGIYFSGLAVVDYVMSMSNQTIGAFESIDKGEPVEGISESKSESSKPKCPYCGTLNDKGAKRCINCKEPLETEN